MVDVDESAVEMPTPDPTSSLVVSPSESDRLARALLDLDGLVRALIKATRPALPWQRKILGHLVEADRALQVLRMSVLMGRDMPEVKAAAAQVRKACSEFKTAVAGSRVDKQTQVALGLAHSLAVGVEEELGRS